MVNCVVPVSADNLLAYNLVLVSLYLVATLPGSPATFTGQWRTRRIFANRFRMTERQT